MILDLIFDLFPQLVCRLFTHAPRTFSLNGKEVHICSRCRCHVQDPLQ